MKTVLTLCLTCFSLVIYSQETLEDFRLNFMRDYAPEGFENASESTIDSVLQEEGMFVYFGNEFYGPDSLFRTMTLHGEYCAMHCKPFYETKFVLEKEGIEFTDINLAEVYEIIDLGNGYYLLMQLYGIRPTGFFLAEGLAAAVFCYREENSHFVPIYYSHPINGNTVTEYNTTGMFSIEQAHYLDVEQVLDFDHETGVLSYQYSLDLEYWLEEPGGMTYTGTFVWKGDHFEHVEERATPFELKDR